MKLAGVKESSFHLAKEDQIAKVVGKHVAEMLAELGIDKEDMKIVFDDIYHTIKRYLTSVMPESNNHMVEAAMPEQEEDEDVDLDHEEPSENWDDADDFVPGAAAWGHSGHWDNYYDNERESGAETENKSLRQLRDEGYTDEEILELLKTVK